MAKYSNQQVVTELKRLFNISSDVELAELLATKKQNINQFQKGGGNTLAHSIISALLDVNYELEKKVCSLEETVAQLSNQASGSN